ncbi:hypothetical protein GQX74_005632 [Glossina fuscipes]|nr:hypothetical protein GQX74_005632 [Glossina fuscipes]
MTLCWFVGCAIISLILTVRASVLDLLPISAESKQVEPSASIASVLTDLASVPTVNSENRKSADMLFNRSVPAGQGREIPSTGLKVENANGNFVQLQIMAPRKSIFLVRAAADTPIDDILQFMSVKNTGITNCPISTFQFNYKQPRKLGHLEYTDGLLSGDFYR